MAGLWTKFSFFTFSTVDLILNIWIYDIEHKVDAVDNGWCLLLVLFEFSPWMLQFLFDVKKTRRMLLIMVGAPFPGRHLARDLIASVEDALQTPTLMITIIIKVIIISVIIMAYQHIPSGQNRTMVGFVTNSDDHYLHRQRFLGQTKIFSQSRWWKNHTCFLEVEQVQWHLLLDGQVRGYHRYFPANFQLVPLHKGLTYSCCSCLWCYLLVKLFPNVNLVTISASLILNFWTL